MSVQFLIRRLIEGDNTSYGQHFVEVFIDLHRACLASEAVAELGFNHRQSKFNV
jgi:hypothetical protein